MALLEQHKMPAVFDLMTIDMDGNDFYVAEALDTSRFKPRVFVVEFNAYFRSNESCVQRYNESYVWDYGTWFATLNGVSLAALVPMMAAKGYHYITQVSCYH